MSDTRKSLKDYILETDRDPVSWEFYKRQEACDWSAEEFRFTKDRDDYLESPKRIQDLLKDFPEWRFLPINDLNRKTIEIYLDLKIAKRLCNKEQKVIKVPNTNVFKISAPILLSKGISRIVSADKLIAL